MRISTNMFARGFTALAAAVIGLLSHNRAAFADAIPTFLEQTTVTAGAGGDGTEGSQRFEQQLHTPFGLSATAQSAGTVDDGGGASWSTSAVGSGGCNGAGIYGLASASALLDGLVGIGADGYASVDVMRTVIVHLADPSHPTSLSCFSTVNGSILNGGALNYDITVSDGSASFSTNVTSADFSVNGSTEQIKATGTLNNVTDGTVLTISQGFTLDANIPGTGSASDDDDFSDTFWLQMLPTTSGVTLETSDGTDFTQAYVPEPASLATLTVAGGLLLWGRRARSTLKNPTRLLTGRL